MKSLLTVPLTIIGVVVALLGYMVMHTDPTLDVPRNTGDGMTQLFGIFLILAGGGCGLLAQLIKGDSNDPPPNPTTKSPGPHSPHRPSRTVASDTRLKQTATKEDEAPPTKVQQVEEQQLGPSDADVKEEEASYAAPEVAIDSAIGLRKMFDPDATGSDRNSESRQDYSTPPTPVTEPERSHNFHSGVVISFFHGRCSHIIYRIRDHARREG